MDLKFVVLALVISVAAGEADRKIESPTLGTNKAVESIQNEEYVHAMDAAVSKKPGELLHDIIKGINIAPHETTVKASVIPSPTINVPTPANDTTTTTTTTTTPSANTTSTTTTTTTPSTNTTTTTTTTTTPATTTTTNLPTTSNAPNTSNVPEEGKWIVNESNSVCIMMQMEIELNVTYPGNNSGSTYYKIINVPKTANASGHCNNSDQNIAIKWTPGNVLNISFARNTTTKKFQINSLNLYVITKDFKNIRDNLTNITFVSTKPDFPLIPLKMSYKCDKQLKQALQSSDKYNATLLISHTQFEAFMDNKTVFGEVKDCDEFDTPDIVPIAVGCVLVILVLIVLVAYLIGRRRSQSRGYLSM